MADPLPVHAALPALRAALLDGRNAVLEAPPGAGKSTVVPLALLDEPWARGRRVLLLEPRRLAARAVAARMASTLREPVGATVGYRMRLDTKVGPATRLEVITEGVLTRMLQRDPALEGVAAVLFDEFHERSLQADLGLALALEAQETVAPELRLLVMSATLDGEAVARLLGGAPRVRATGRTFEVDVQYRGRGLPALPDASTPLARFIDPLAVAVRQILADTDGDVLMFLPGVPEIRRLHGALDAQPDPLLDIHELSGDLAIERQEAALAPARPGRRKLVLSTNVAETSLTIEGVRVVIDSGLVRRSLFDPGTGMSSLVTQRISQSSATQRAGRAGRVAAGSAFRLWGEGAQATLAPQTRPEIATADLAPLALELAAWGVTDPAQLRWLDVPVAAAMAQARALLVELEALDEAGRSTAHGREMSSLGLHPRLAHLLLRARRAGFGGLAARLVALLSERDVLRGERDPDLRSRLEALRSGVRIDPGALARIRRHAASLDGSRAGDDADVGRLLAWAFPDRIAQRRAGVAGRYLLSNGRGAVLREASTLGSADYLVAVDLDDADSAAARIRLAAPVSLEDLEFALGARIVEATESGFDDRTQAVQSRRVRRLGALVLAEKPVAMDRDSMASAVLSAIRAAGVSTLPWDEASNGWRARVRFVTALPSETGWPAVDDATLLADAESWLSPAIDGISRLSQLSRVDLVAALRTRLDYAASRRLDELAPTHLTMPTGTRVPVDYLDDNAPCIEVRMQEVFGLAETPRIGGGRVPVTLKLLSPARRPMQITRDLGGFWRGSYAEVRKDMRGRYPKHYWPENPLEAEPRRGVRR
ncbi:MAG: ATP-dependent helicase HrpB [Steroidobacteraceae bacterium]